MSEENVKVAPQEEPQILKTKIGNTEYVIRMNFRPDAKETMSDKVKRMIKKDVENILIYAKTKQWWDTIDFLDKIIGNIGLRDNRVNDLMIALSKCDDMWLRRLAIDHQNGRKEKTNSNLLEEIIVNNFGSKEFFINKAIGWALRDYSKVNPEWVRDFIVKHKDELDKLSIKEASKYI